MDKFKLPPRRVRCYECSKEVMDSEAVPGLTRGGLRLFHHTCLQLYRKRHEEEEDGETR